jgi:hypothetical protein
MYRVSIRSAIVVLAIGGLAGGTRALAWDNLNWEEQGPGPILNGQASLPNNTPVAGAINAIVPNPHSADEIYVGAVSGGVWKTSNATAAVPSWIPLTDHPLPELPIKSLAVRFTQRPCLLARAALL